MITYVIGLLLAATFFFCLFGVFLKIFFTQAWPWCERILLMYECGRACVRVNCHHTCSCNPHPKHLIATTGKKKSLLEACSVCRLCVAARKLLLHPLGDIERGEGDERESV